MSRRKLRVFENVEFNDLIVIHRHDGVYCIDESGMRKLDKIFTPRWLLVSDEGNENWKRIV